MLELQGIQSSLNAIKKFAAGEPVDDFDFVILLRLQRDVVNDFLPIRRHLITE